MKSNTLYQKKSNTLNYLHFKFLSQTSQKSLTKFTNLLTSSITNKSFKIYHESNTSASSR